MEVLSAAWRTDLALLADAGSRVEHHPTHVVVRTPGNPAYRWGNFVLLRRTPLRRDVAGWLDRFADLVPGALLDLEPGAAAALLELERATARRPDYLPLATQLHLLAR